MYRSQKNDLATKWTITSSTNCNLYRGFSHRWMATEFDLQQGRCHDVTPLECRTWKGQGYGLDLLSIDIERFHWPHNVSNYWRNPLYGGHFVVQPSSSPAYLYKVGFTQLSCFIRRIIQLNGGLVANFECRRANSFTVESQVYNKMAAVLYAWRHMKTLYPFERMQKASAHVIAGQSSS